MWPYEHRHPLLLPGQPTMLSDWLSISLGSSWGTGLYYDLWNKVYYVTWRGVVVCRTRNEWGAALQYGIRQSEAS